LADDLPGCRRWSRAWAEQHFIAPPIPIAELFVPLPGAAAT
jgi:hypothetical protein